MSSEITVPLVGKVAIRRFVYKSGRVGLVAATKDTKEGDYFNLTLDIDSVAPHYIILKEYDEAQLVNKYLMECGVLIHLLNKPRNLGYNKIYYCGFAAGYNSFGQ
jgi:hypothetical protein